MLRSFAKWLRCSSSPITRKPSRTRLMFDTLEARDVPALFLVTNGNDSGAGSLRRAVNAANSNGVSDVIYFDAGVTNVTLTSGEIAITEGNTTTISGFYTGGTTIQRSTAGGTPNFRVFRADSGTDFVLAQLTIKNGYDTGSFGGGGVLANGSLTMDHCEIANNWSNFGGGVYSQASLNMTDCNIRNNFAFWYGGGVSGSGNTTITRCVFASNTGMNNGGGLYAQGNLTLADSVFRLCSSSEGGGLYYISAGQFTSAIVRGCSFFQNTADLEGIADFASQGAGGAIWARGNLSLLNSTLDNNTAFKRGSAIYFSGFINGAGYLNVTNATIYLNIIQDTTTGGGIFTETNGYSLTTLQNSIVAGNYCRDELGQTTMRELDGANVQSASSHNLIQDAATAGGLTNGVNGNKVGVNAGLVAAQTDALGRRFYALAATSPALNAGDSSLVSEPFDQRGSGNPRKVGAVDIGAIEMAFTTQVVYDSNGNMLIRDIVGRNDDFTVQKSGTNLVVTNPGMKILSSVGTVSADGSTLTVPLTTIRGRLTIAGADGNDRATFLTDDASFPVFYGSMRFDGGAGVDTFVARGDVSCTLSDTLLLMSTSKRILLLGVGVPIPERAIIVGGAGNNIIDARTYTGTAVLDGQAGSDRLYGSSTGCNLLIGGLGNDTLQGSATNRDLLIGGVYTGANTFDATFTPIIDKWVTVTASNFFVVVAQMKAGTGIGASLAFTAARLPNDGARDSITGLGKNDWYWAYLPDVTDKSTATIGNEADALN